MWSVSECPDSNALFHSRCPFGTQCDDALSDPQSLGIPKIYRKDAERTSSEKKSEIRIFVDQSMNQMINQMMNHMICSVTTEALWWTQVSTVQTTKNQKEFGVRESMDRERGNEKYRE